MEQRKCYALETRSRVWMRILGLAVVVSYMLGLATSQSWAGSRADAHAPIGVMGDHMHNAGEWMLSYRYMRMRMNGNRDNDDRISASKVLQKFRATPTRMDMEMHMFGVMYAPIDRITLSLMVPLLQANMGHRLRNDGRFTTRSDGIGDIRVAGLIRLFEKDHHHVHAQLGLSFPSGSITEQDQTPGAVNNGVKTGRLPFPMQLGSGTYDFLPGLTYTAHDRAFSWGAQARGTVRLNENHANYRKGNAYALTAWGGIKLASWISTTIRFEWEQSFNYSGRDESPSVNPSLVPPVVSTVDPGRRAAARLNALLGVNFIMPSGPLSGFRLAIEAGLPAYQRLDGPQLETDWILTTGVQYAF